MMKNFLIVTTLAAAFVLSGCSAPRGLRHEMSAPQQVVDAPQAQEVAAFSATVGNMNAGVSVMNGTPLGTAQVAWSGATYKNALGETCRRVEVKSKNDKMPAGVCLGRDGIWRYVALQQ